MESEVKSKLKTLPKDPGVYLFKNALGEVIYVGKAAILKNRVRSYFAKRLPHDYKTQVLIREIADLDWLVTASEIDALFVESAMIKRYLPRYNIDLRDDKNFLYIRIPIKDDFPVVSYVRRPLDDTARYFGPFTTAWAVRKAMRYLRRSFPYVTHRTLPKRACLHYHIGLCPGPEIDAITSEDYKRNLRRLILYLQAKSDSVILQLEREMRQAAKTQQFETAADLRNKVQNLKALARRHLFGDKELFDLSRDEALVELAKILSLAAMPRRIECYDISHLGGQQNTAGMVVFTDGVPHRGEYRKFKMRLSGNDDFAHMSEVIKRRFRADNLKKWARPDLIVIDGGKGQLSSALSSLDEYNLKLPVIGLAKRQEDIVRVVGPAFETIRLAKTSHALKLLMHIRDEAHRFAVAYHSLLRAKRQIASPIEEIPGIGPVTRKKLIKHFGSFRALKLANEAEISKIVGPQKTRLLKSLLA